MATSASCGSCHSSSSSPLLRYWSVSLVWSLPTPRLHLISGTQHHAYKNGDIFLYSTLAKVYCWNSVFYFKEWYLSPFLPPLSLSLSHSLPLSLSISLCLQKYHNFILVHISGSGDTAKCWDSTDSWAYSAERILHLYGLDVRCNIWLYSNQLAISV